MVAVSVFLNKRSSFCFTLKSLLKNYLFFLSNFGLEYVKLNGESHAIIKSCLLDSTRLVKLNWMIPNSKNPEKFVSVGIRFQTLKSESKIWRQNPILKFMAKNENGFGLRIHIQKLTLLVTALSFLLYSHTFLFLTSSDVFYSPFFCHCFCLYFFIVFWFHWI